MEMNNNEATLLKWAEQRNFDDSDIESVTTIYHQIIIVNRKSKSRKKIKKLKRINTIPGSNFVCRKNRYKWSKISPMPKYTPTFQHNIVVKCPGLKKNNVHNDDLEQV